MASSAQREAWLSQVVEPILAPEVPICDPHHHLWDREDKPYLLPELLEDLGSGHHVVSTVFVECGSMYRAQGPSEMASLGETEFVNGIAAMSASGQYGPAKICAGIVSYADMTLGEAVGPVLDAHMAASSRFRGIRHAAGWDASDAVRNSHTYPPQSLYRDEQFRRGIEQLSARGLSFDAWLYHTQIHELTELARDFPELPIIIDHFGGPLGIGPYAGRQDEIFQQWQVAYAALAECDNVYAKLGGLAMPINGFGWHKRATPATSDEVVAATGRFHRFAIEAFGPRRCMFESNFPVDKQSCSYAVLWNAFKKIAAQATDEDRRWLFHDTAATAYGLRLLDQ